MMLDTATGRSGRYFAADKAWFAGPAGFAFFGSLLLSLIAVLGSAGLNRDGMLYVDTARVFLDSGFAAAKANYDWPFFPIAIGWLSRVTSLSLESAAYLLSALLMAGACAVLVRITRRQFPAGQWAAVVIVLSLPALNGYRADLVREFGYWFFVLAGFLAAMKWAEQPNWRGATSIQLLFACACLFRLEAVALYPALILWQVFGTAGRDRWRNLWMLSALPLAVVTLIAGLLVSGVVAVEGRFEYYLNAIDPIARYQEFNAAAARMADAILPKFSSESAPAILFFGLAATIPLAIIEKTGVFLILLYFAFRHESKAELIRRWQPLPWAFLLYVIVLLAFLMNSLFLTGRYVVFLSILATPLLALGLHRLTERRPRWRVVLVVLCALVAIANVVSFGVKKTHYPEAGAWLSENVDAAARVYFESPRIAYHAGRSYAAVLEEVMPREQLVEQLAASRYDLVVFDVDDDDAGFAAWLESAGLIELRRFTNKGGDAVVVAAPRPR